jgi:hypothetical protein
MGFSCDSSFDNPSLREPHLSINRSYICLIPDSAWLHVDPAATVGAQGPDAAKASPAPGQGGMVIAMNASGEPASARN